MQCNKCNDYIFRLNKMRKISKISTNRKLHNTHSLVYVLEKRYGGNVKGSFKEESAQRTRQEEGRCALEHNTI